MASTASASGQRYADGELGRGRARLASSCWPRLAGLRSLDCLLVSAYLLTARCETPTRVATAPTRVASKGMITSHFAQEQHVCSEAGRYPPEHAAQNGGVSVWSKLAGSGLFSRSLLTQRGGDLRGVFPRDKEGVSSLTTILPDRETLSGPSALVFKQPADGTFGAGGSRPPQRSAFGGGEGAMGFSDSLEDDYANLTFPDSALSSSWR
jgi:hypothetical protein